MVTLYRIKSWPLSASKVGILTMCCLLKFYRQRPSLAITLVASSEMGLVGSSLPLECELVTPLLQILIRRYHIPGVSHQLGGHDDE